MVATRKQKKDDDNKRTRDEVPSLPNSTTKTGSRGSGTSKPRKLAFDGAEHDRSDANSDAALAMPADAGPEALAFISAMQSKMEKLQRELAALKGPRPQIDDDDDDAQGFEAVDDDASSPAPLIVAPSVSLSREVNQLFEALARAKERRLWGTLQVARTLDSLHVVARKLLSGDGVASQLRTQRLALTETLESQLSRAASVVKFQRGDGGRGVRRKSPEGVDVVRVPLREQAHRRPGLRLELRARLADVVCAEPGYQGLTEAMQLMVEGDKWEMYPVRVRIWRQRLTAQDPRRRAARLPDGDFEY